MNIDRFQIEKNIWRICIDGKFAGNIIKSSIRGRDKFITKINKLLNPKFTTHNYNTYVLAENHIKREFRENRLKNLGFEEITEDQKRYNLFINTVKFNNESFL